jgi:hypothetical protein
MSATPAGIRALSATPLAYSTASMIDNDDEPAIQVSLQHNGTGSAGLTKDNPASHISREPTNARHIRIPLGGDDAEGIAFVGHPPPDHVEECMTAHELVVSSVTRIANVPPHGSSTSYGVVWSVSRQLGQQ